MAVDTDNVQKQTKSSKKKKGIVSFDDELINKERATEVLSKLPKSNLQSSNDLDEVNYNKKNEKKKKKTKKLTEKVKIENDDTHFEEAIKAKKNKIPKEQFYIDKNASDDTNQVKKEKTITSPKKIKQKNYGISDSNQVKKEIIVENPKKIKQENGSISKNKKKKKLKEERSPEVEEESVSKSNEEIDIAVGNEHISDTPTKTEESKRAKKRKKHLELLAAKKLKITVATQEIVLNYLSKWKYTRSEWKFEKLKQIWLSQNLFDSTKIPKEFWETTLEYFLESKGFIRKLILRDALKIVEKEDTADEENLDEEYQSKLKRARDVIQSLQE